MPNISTDASRRFLKYTDLSPVLTLDDRQQLGFTQRLGHCQNEAIRVERLALALCYAIQGEHCDRDASPIWYLAQDLHTALNNLSKEVEDLHSIRWNSDRQAKGLPPLA